MTRSAFESELLSRIARLVPKPSSIVVAVSGGPDSCALLLGFNAVNGALQHQLHVAHFDHQYRVDSGDDARFVQKLAERLQLPFHCQTAEKTDHFSEESARKQRYRFLENTAHQVKAPYVAVGHTRDDQTETILMAVLRGTGLVGLRGIPETRTLGSDADVQLVRPLLAFSREEILEYLRLHGLEARVDSSNADERFLRNRVRNELLPLLRDNYNPQADAALLRLGELAARGLEVIQVSARELFEKSLVCQECDVIKLSLKPLRDAGPALVSEMLHWLLSEKDWPRQQMGKREIDRLTSLVFQQQPRAWDLPNHIRGERRRGILQITRATNPQSLAEE